MSNPSTLVKISFDLHEPFSLLCELQAAHRIVFRMDYSAIGYEVALGALCRVAPHLLAYDADVTEAYDNAYKTQPRPDDRIRVRTFFDRYYQQIQPIEPTGDLRELYR